MLPTPNKPVPLEVVMLRLLKVVFPVLLPRSTPVPAELLLLTDVAANVTAVVEF